MTTQPPDRHQAKRTTLRNIPDDLKTEVHRILDAHTAEPKWTLNDLLIASMVMLTKNPAAYLKRLEEFRPPYKRGRPPKTPPAEVE